MTKKLSDIKARLFEDPDVRQAYDDLQPEYREANRSIMDRAMENGGKVPDDIAREICPDTLTDFLGELGKRDEVYSSAIQSLEREARSPEQLANLRRLLASDPPWSKKE